MTEYKCKNCKFKTNNFDTAYIHQVMTNHRLTVINDVGGA